jgi:hypothetical protein
VSSSNLAILIGVFFVLDAIIVGCVLHLAAGELKSFVRHFPPVEPQPGHESRSFQTIALDTFNFGWCFHIASDRDHVHLRPTWFLRRFGVTPCSIPRAALANPRRTFRGASVTVRGHTVRGPRWCLMPDLR